MLFVSRLDRETKVYWNISKKFQDHHLSYISVLFKGEPSFVQENSRIHKQYRVTLKFEKLLQTLGCSAEAWKPETLHFWLDVSKAKLSLETVFRSFQLHKHV